MSSCASRAGLGAPAVSVTSATIVGRPPLSYVHPARGVVAFANECQRRVFFLTFVDSEGAARVERAPLRQVTQVWRQSLDWNQLLVRYLVQSRHGAQEAQRVR